ncbi:hypothetical protein MTR_6g044300 [Medicago truncatula]|uniref:Uncharacterized protein n=1 Tax=Medicago truncatula TaxID=3880 RepID=G7KJ03_MEDTR|nr:hypothetical protein MTR_6g044300 [Medicago truncatula]
MIFRATKEARQLIEGSEREQYGLTPEYARELIRKNTSSTVKINTIPSKAKGATRRPKNKGERRWR